MKKIIISILAAGFFSSVFALSWSGLIDNNSRFSANDDFSVIGLNQGNGIYFSINSPVSKSGNVKFSAEALYKYSLSGDFDSNKFNFKNIADCDLLKISGNWAVGKGSLALNAGRFVYSDFAATVFNQSSDGLYLSYNTHKIGASFYAGYTGLLNRLNVSMVDNEYEKDEQFYRLCPGYIPLIADFSYKTLFGTSILGLQAEFFVPASDKNTLKAYGTLSYTGLFGTIGNYNAKVIAGTEKFDGLMLDGKLDLNFFVVKNMVLTAGGEYVSGAQGSIKPFVTISARGFGSAPFYNGVIVPKAAVVYAANKLYAGLTERVIIAMPKDEAKLNGFDTSVNVLYNLFSDLQVGCDIGAYICTEEKKLSNYSATIKASLAF